MDFDISLIIFVITVILIFALSFYIILAIVFDSLNEDKINNYVTKFNQHLKRKVYDLVSNNDIDPGLTEHIELYPKEGFKDIISKSDIEFEDYDKVKYDYLSQTVGVLTYNQILDEKYGSDSEKCKRKKGLISKGESKGTYHGVLLIICLFMTFAPLLY